MDADDKGVNWFWLHPAAQTSARGFSATCILPAKSLYLLTGGEASLCCALLFSPIHLFYTLAALRISVL